MVFDLQLPGFLGAFLGERDDHLDHRLETFLAEHHGAEHDLFGQLLGFRLDHHDSVVGAGHHQIEIAFGELLEGRVQDILAVLVADAGAADRTEKRNARNREGSTGADHGGDVRIVLLIMGENGADDLGLVLEACREQRAKRTVDQARGQRVLFRGTAFALEEAARDLAGGIELFLIIHGEREKILAWPDAARGTCRAEHHRFTIGDHDGPVGLARNAPAFQNERLTAPFHFFS